MRSDKAARSALLVVFWSSGFVGATLVTRDAPVQTALAWRTIVTAVVLGGAALVKGERISAPVLGRQAVLGLLVQAVYLGAVFAAAGAGVPTGTVALIAALQPLLVAGLAGPLLGTAPTRRQVAGLLVGAAGVALVVAGDLGAAPSAWAFLLPVVAVIGLATGSLLDGRWTERPPLVMSLAVQSAVAAIVFSAVAAWSGQLTPPASGDFWTAIAWLVVLSAVGGYGSYLLVVRRDGPTHASTLLYLTPPTVAVWAWAMFGQRPGPLAVPGVLVCALGVALFATPRRARALRLSSSATGGSSGTSGSASGRAGPGSASRTPPIRTGARPRC